jgi:hypothetical protein
MPLGQGLAGVGLPILELQDIYGPTQPPGPRRTKRLSAPGRATPVPGRSEPRCTQDDTRRPGQAGTEVAQARRRARPEPAAAGQATPAGRPTARRDLVPSAATLGRGLASDRRDGHAQRHEGGAERDHRALAPAGNDAEPLADLTACLPRARVPCEGNEYRRPARPGAMTMDCRWPGPGESARAGA